MRPELSAANQVLADSILSRAERNYPRYRSNSQEPVYNFWQTNPSRHFPNSAYFSSRKKYIIPDDLDDTAILYLATGGNDSLKAIVRRLMAENANGNKSWIRNTFRRYQKVPAYSTWFGKKNVPVDFDICVQANGLRFVLDNDFELNRHDSATIQLIADIVRRDKHLTRPAYVAPHYQDPAIILYHLARLVAPYATHPLLSDLKPLLITDLCNQLEPNDAGMQRLLLESSLLRLGVLIPVKQAVTPPDLNTFYFFVANMTSLFPNPIKGLFVKSRKTNFFYRCRAYYLTLMLEHALLSRRLMEP